MKFACPHCSQHLEAEESLSGQSIGCPACSQLFVVPTPATTAPARRTFQQVALIALAVLALGGTTGWFLFAKEGSQKRGELAELKVFPSEVNLQTKQDRQSVVVQAIYPDGVTRDVTLEASFSFGNKAFARVEKGTLYPVADGTTELQIRYGGRSLKVPLKVAQASVERPVSYVLDVMPVFSKAGCNSGGCHGASRGKDGFQMSLFGFDPDGDYFRLTRENVGRRVNLAIPEESLLIEKALGRVPHGGGERFKSDSELYGTLLRWIQAGAPKDGTNVPKVVGLEIMPKQAVLEGQGASQKLSVRAKYSDGSDRDVSTLAVFISNNDVSAKVSDDGIITAGQRGEAFVMARFEAFNVGAQVVVVPKDLPYTWPTDIAEYNYIDQHIHAKLKKLRITPSGLCDDATFIRRAYIDITGTLPTVEQVQKFVDEPSAGKRDALVDELLGRKEFADLWVMKWAELLQIRSRNDEFSSKAALQYYNWLRDRMVKNVPIDRIVKDLLTASGGNFEHPAASYYQVERDTLKIAENTAQVFMGMRIQCAQCHNHPFDRWTVDDYYSFAAFFAQIGRKPGDDPRETVIYDRKDGEVKHLVSGKPMKPKFLGGDIPEIKKESRRQTLAKWLASPENPYFAQNMANIIWAHFMGKGIIDPVDDVRISNPAINPELLEALGTKFTEYQYDFKKLVRDICTSRAYQLSTRPNDTNGLDERNFSKANVRRMRAEVLLDCISGVTETKDKFQGLPRGAHAVQIADGSVTSYFLSSFGRATRETVCSCEVKVEPNLSQALHLLNGSTVQDKINEGGVVKRLLKQGKKPEEIIDDLYLRCLARTPTEKEKAKLNTFFKEGKKPEVVLNDLFWSLLNSKEFIFNH